MLPYMQVIEGPRERLLFGELYTAYAGRMLALARQKLRDPADAEDAVQQAFLALAEHFTRLSRLPRPQLEAYLVVVTERKCIDLLRRRGRLDGAPFDEETALVSPPPCGEPVADAMARLEPACREVLLLRFAFGYSTRETAALLDISFAAAQKRLQRAKAALRTELEKEGISV